MSSALRLSIIMVLLLATAALGLLTYTHTCRSPSQVAQSRRAHRRRPSVLCRGASAAGRHIGARRRFRGPRRAVRRRSVRGDPRYARRQGRASRFSGSQSFSTRQPRHLADVLRPRDRGFLASVLAPDSRAISINVDAESGVSGLIWPGDYVDVVLTQVNDKADPAHRALSETVFTTFASLRSTRRSSRARPATTPRPAR